MMWRNYTMETSYITLENCSDHDMWMLIEEACKLANGQPWRIPVTIQILDEVEDA